MLVREAPIFSGAKKTFFWGIIIGREGGTDTASGSRCAAVRKVIACTAKKRFGLS